MSQPTSKMPIAFALVFVAVLAQLLRPQLIGILPWKEGPFVDGFTTGLVAIPPLLLLAAAVVVFLALRERRKR